MSFRASRIAILDPSVCYSRPPAALSRLQLAQETAQWAAQVQRHRADAVYLRLHSGMPWEKRVIDQISRETGFAVLVSGVWRENVPPGGSVHLRAFESFPKPPGSYLGQSCHSLAEVQSAAARGADYVFLSPVFPTPTHPDAAPLGTEALADICAQISIPIYALGGLTEDRIPTVEAAGAAGIAAIRLFLA